MLEVKLTGQRDPTTTGSGRTALTLKNLCRQSYLENEER